MDFQSFPSGQSAPIVLSGYGLTTQSIAIPKSAKWVYVYLVAPGGTGGNGFSRAAGSAGGGGGGGGPGGQGRALIAANLFRGILPINFTALGSPSIFLSNKYPAFSILSAGTGGNGTAGTGAAVGAVGGVGTFTNNAMYADSITVAGSGAGAGGAVAGAIGGVISSNQFFGRTGGAGGAGCTTTNFAGGSIANTTLNLTLAGGLAAGGAGQHGVYIDEIDYSLGGSGGGSNNSGTGGAGGNGGGYGAGGGGGGVGVTGGIGGIGSIGVVKVWWL